MAKTGNCQIMVKKNFLSNIGNERSQILIVYGHDSHNLVELLETAVANEIIIIELQIDFSLVTVLCLVHSIYTIMKNPSK